MCYGIKTNIIMTFLIKIINSKKINLKITEKIYIQKTGMGTAFVMTEFIETTVGPRLSKVIMGRRHMDKLKLQLIYSDSLFIYLTILYVCTLSCYKVISRLKI